MGCYDTRYGTNILGNGWQGEMFSLQGNRTSPPQEEVTGWVITRFRLAVIGGYWRLFPQPIPKRQVIPAPPIKPRRINQLRLQLDPILVAPLQNLLP